jgi:hypothetical protein
MSDSPVTTDHSVLAADRETLVRYAAYTAAHTDKTLAEYHKTVMAEVQTALTTYVPAAVKQSEADAKALEDVRANRRNRNRTYTLVVALMFTFLVPYIVANILHDASLLKYATGIAIFPDALITLWAYVRKY